MLIKLELPFPPTLNTYYRSYNNRPILSAKGRLYKEAVALHYLTTKNRPTMIYGDVGGVLILYPPDNRRRDSDNYFKASWDAIMYAGVINDDSQIKSSNSMFMPKEDGVGRCEVILHDIDDFRKMSKGIFFTS